MNSIKAFIALVVLALFMFSLSKKFRRNKQKSRFKNDFVKDLMHWPA